MSCGVPQTIAPELVGWRDGASVGAGFVDGFGVIGVGRLEFMGAFVCGDCGGDIAEAGISGAQAISIRWFFLAATPSVLQTIYGLNISDRQSNVRSPIWLLLTALCT